jgi:hypothetical protein
MDVYAQSLEATTETRDRTIKILSGYMMVTSKGPTEG